MGVSHPARHILMSNSTCTSADWSHPDTWSQLMTLISSLFALGFLLYTKRDTYLDCFRSAPKRGSKRIRHDLGRVNELVQDLGKMVSQLYARMPDGSSGDSPNGATNAV
jgi:hypothetical protein